MITVRARRFGLPLSLIALFVAVVAVYWPALSSYFVLDDFGLVAYSRLLGDPLALFVHDHIPGSVFYRPLTLALWWASVAVFGHAALPQYALNLALHIAVVAILARLTLALSGSRFAALLAASLFALLPLSIGTALWLSDRFDLLATALGLLAILAALRYRRDPAARLLVATLVLALASFLSKETGLVVAAPIAVLWLAPRENDARFWTAPRLAVLALIIEVGAWLGYRAWLLHGSGSNFLLQGAPLPVIIAEGFVNWIVGYAALLGFWSRLGGLGQLAVGVGALTLCGVAMWGTYAALRTHRRYRMTVALLAALALLLVPGLVQAPVTRATHITLGAVDSPWPAAFVARFYYLSLAGLVLVFAMGVAGALRAIRASSRDALRAVALVATLAVMVPMAGVSRELARQFADASKVGKAVAQAAVKAIDQLPLTRSECRIYLLDTDAASRIFFVPFADSAVKAATTHLKRVRNCLVQGEGTPWFYLVERDSITPRDVAPMLPVYAHRQPIPWLEIGDLEVIYLNLFPGIDARDMHGAFFLSWRNGRFVDVTQAVRSGKRPVTFQCLRSGTQCACPGQACPNGLPHRDAD